MSIQIHPYLLARLIAVQEAFGQTNYSGGFRPQKVAPAPQETKRGNNWKAVIKEDEEGKDGKGGEGGGTIKGLRGNQVEQAKAAMRRLGRK